MKPRSEDIAAMLTAKVRDASEPYATAIETFFLQSWPRVIAPGNGSLLDALTDTLVGSSQNRYGPRPSPEVLVSIRDVLRRTMAAQEPIRILVPWGSKKTINDPGRQLDLAEALALKQLRDLGELLGALWAPGVVFNVQVEDLGGQYLWADDRAALEASRVYVAQFVTLARLLCTDANSNITFKAVPESALASDESFRAVADRISGALGTYLRAPDGVARVSAGRDLADLGWAGGIPEEQVKHYLQAYEKLYPERSFAEQVVILARYFAQAWARYQLGIKTAFDWGRDFLIVSFVPPVPGNPAELQARRLFYRTLPLRQARTHLPPWRAKGFLRMNRDGVTPKLASWHDPVVKDLNTCTLVVSDDNGRIVSLGADYSVPETE